MWDKLLKWGKNPWVWGITIPVGLFVFSRWGGSSATSNSGGDAQPGGLESGVLPMFITGGLGGGGANMIGGSAPLPLGGEIWQPPAVPLSENPDVRIAEIYAGVQRAAIDAQREAQREARLSATESQAVSAAGMAKVISGNISTLNAAAKESATGRAPNAPAGKDTIYATAARTLARKGDYDMLYSLAKTGGYSAAQVASATGISLSDVNAWLKAKNKTL